MAQKILTEYARLVWGHPQRSQPKVNSQTKQPVLGKDGKQIIEWTFGLAYPEQYFNDVLWPVMRAEIATAYPGIMQNPVQMPPTFSYKFKNWRANDRNGVPYANREGWRDHVVLTVSTSAFQPPVFRFDPATGRFIQMNENEHKTGDYYRGSLSFVVNKPDNVANTPSVYVNPEMLEWLGSGTAIVNGPDPMSVFGQGTRPNLPPGASAVPQSGAPAGMAPPGAGGYGAPPAQTGYVQPPQNNGGYYAPPGQQPAQPGYAQPPQNGGGMPPAPGQAPGYGAPQQPAYGGPPQQPGYQPAADHMAGMTGQPYQPGPHPGMPPAPGGYAQPPQNGGMPPAPGQQPGYGAPPHVSSGMPGQSPQPPGPGGYPGGYPSR